MNTNPTPLGVALTAAHRAGELLAERWGAEHTVTVKGYRDQLTEVDLAAEAIILALIRRHFPDHAILSEEAGAQGAAASTTWIVDPLDGTTNYARNHPTFSVSIAVAESGTLLAGVVHDPLRGHTFTAQRDGGALLNGQTINPSRTIRLSDALLGVDWAHSDDDRADVLRRLIRLAPCCRTVRALGSAALALCYIAAGWLDVYFARQLHPWDTAAASLVVAEAGGMLTTLDGGPWNVERSDVLASNGRLHPSVLTSWQ